jgi:hypothetical protein
MVRSSKIDQDKFPESDFDTTYYKTKYPYNHIELGFLSGVAFAILFTVMMVVLMVELDNTNSVKLGNVGNAPPRTAPKPPPPTVEGTRNARYVQSVNRTKRE